MVAVISPPQSTLWRCRQVYWCRLGSTIIALDLARDRYLSLTGSAEPFPAATPRRSPGSDADRAWQQARQGPDETSRIIRTLIARGVLPVDSQAAAATALHWSSAGVALDANIPRNRQFRWGDVVTFLAACVATFWLLRCRSLQHAIEAVASRQATHGSAANFNIELAADLIAIFRRLRSFTFSGDRRCLFHALALVNFLSRYGVYPHFVMGVKIEPWAAHSWVQSGEYVLDGTPEQVRFFTPLLVV
jgi:hypothetical protein